MVVDRATAARFGITSATIDNALYDAFGQRIISTLYTQSNQYRVILQAGFSDSKTFEEALNAIYLPSATSTTGQVPLSSIVHLSTRNSPLQVEHLGQFPAVSISFNLAPDASLDEAVAEIANAERDIGLPHAEIELVVVKDQIKLNIGVEIDEFVHARRQPRCAKAHSCRNAQLARGLLTGIDETGFDLIELHENFARGAKQEFALLGQDQTAGMAMKQRNIEILLKRAYLAADSRLAHIQLFASVRKTACFGGSMEYPQFIPVHARPLLFW